MDLFKSRNQQALNTQRNIAAMYNPIRKSEANDINIQGGAGKWNADAFEKSKGEGSKGGKVIGHTKSGKPVYAKYNEFPKDHDKQDFLDASEVHSKAAKGEKNAEKKELHQSYASAFSQIAAQHDFVNGLGKN